MKLKGLHWEDVAEIQEVVTDELKRVPKEEFSAAFRNYTTAQKPVYIYRVSQKEWTKLRESVP